MDTSLSSHNEEEWACFSHRDLWWRERARACLAKFIRPRPLLCFAIYRSPLQHGKRPNGLPRRRITFFRPAFRSIEHDLCGAIIFMGSLLGVARAVGDPKLSNDSFDFLALNFSQNRVSVVYQESKSDLWIFLLYYRNIILDMKI